MAVTFAIGTPSTTNASSYATASFTPAIGDLLLIFVQVTGATGASPSLVDSLKELSYAMISNVLKNSSADTVYTFIALNVTKTGTARTITFNTSGAATATGACVQVYRISTQSRVGLDAVRQVVSQPNQAAAGTPTPIFSKTTITTNPCFTAIGNETDPPGLTAPTTWTSDSSIGYATPTSGGQCCHIATGFSGTSVIWGNTSATAFGSVAVEIDASTAPISPQLYENMVMSIENPGFDITTTQGFLSGQGSISEPDTGDSPEEWPAVGANVFLAPTYTNMTMSSENPGFDNSTTQGFLSWDVAEADIGDNVEVTPQVYTIVQMTMMGWKGYYVPQRILAEFEDMPVLAPTVYMLSDLIMMGYKGYAIPKRSMIDLMDYGVENIPTTVTIVDYTWDDHDQHPQVSFVADQMYEGIETSLPQLYSWQDLILMSYSGYRISPANMILADEGVEKIPTVITTIYNDWTNDSENQISNQWMSVDQMYEGIETTPPQPYRAWDDEQNQILQILGFGQDTLSDEGVEYITLPPFIDEVDDLVDE